MSFINGDYRDYKVEPKIPFCPKCHSYPCSCDDNIIEKDSWPKLRYDDPNYKL